MNIGVYVPFLAKNTSSVFIVGTFFPLFEQFKEHRILIITDDNNITMHFSNFETLAIKRQPKRLLLKKFWVERTLVNVLKEKKADLFISLDSFCSLKAVIPQSIFISDAASLKLTYAKKANLVLVTNEIIKKELINKFNIDENKISIVYPFARDEYSPIDFVARESIKDKYAEAKEYFLYTGSFKSEDEFKNLLKAYSHFKKRQQSSFKLVILSDRESSYLKSLENYKYREDVIVQSNTLQESELIAAAYAIVLPFGRTNDLAVALNAMKCNVPVIAIKDSAASEVAKDAGLYAENEIKDMGEKMMQLYKDEGLRYSLIQKGTELVKSFTKEALADQLRVSIMKAMN